jgi:hypothetical protein
MRKIQLNLQMDCRSTFEHTPLDQTKGAFRLLKVLPDLSTDGLIECEIWHDDTDATYTCLSYVWGSDVDHEEILLNGKSLQCRQNLWDFLNVARAKYATTPEAFWIDALCIDQTNFLERNQQVAQMGDIYSSATTVLIWLGCNENIAHFLSVLDQLAAESPSTEKRAKRFWYQGKSKQKQTGWLSFMNSVYWTRAWITQEIFLAQSIRISAQETEIGIAELKALALLFPHLDSIFLASKTVTNSAHCKDMVQTMELYLRIMVGDKNTSLAKRGGLGEFENNMLDLSRFLRHRESQIPRDRIYSLRSIAKDGDKITVDYGTSDKECMLQVLKSLNDSLCLCSLAHIAKIFGYSCSSIVDQSNRLPTVKLPVPKTSATHERGAYRYTGPNKLLPSSVNGKFQCAACHLYINVDVTSEQTICLYELCVKRLKCHLIIRNEATSDSSLPMLRVVSKEGTEWRMVASEKGTDWIRGVPKNSTECGINLENYEAEERKIETQDHRSWRRDEHRRDWGPGTVDISMHFDSWIQIAMCTASSDSTMCFEAREGGRSESALSRAIRAMSIS